MKLALAGYNGFIGKNILESGSEFEFVLINRALLYGDHKTLAEKISGVDVVINFAGSSIFKRWTKRNKKRIRNSRIIVTRNIVTAINECKNKPGLFIEGSAVGLYNSINKHTESSQSFSAGFLSNLVKEWEKELTNLNINVNSVIVRSGIVLGNNGGMFPDFFRLSRFFGPVIPGDGKNDFPFIHIRDFVRGIFWIIANNKKGIYNFVAPSEIKFEDFVRSLGQALNKEYFIKIPGWFLKFFLGGSASLLLEGQSVVPERMLVEGFVFQFIDIRLAIKELIAIKE